jgi:hypothetical protein
MKKAETPEDVSANRDLGDYCCNRKYCAEPESGTVT